MFEQMKRLLLAGIGGAAMSVDKAEEAINNLVKKGRLTVEEGKELTSELIHRGDKKTVINQDELHQALIEMNFAQQEDISKLEERVRQLEEQVAEFKKEV